MTVDLTGTSPQVSDRPINLPFEGTVDCAVWLTLRSILLDSAVYGNIPQNSGLTRPITIVAPKGTLANPIFPAPVIARFCPGQRARRYGHEGSGAGRAPPGQRRHRQSARHCIQRCRPRSALGPHGDSRRQLWRPLWSRWHGHRRYALCQYAQQSDRGYRIASAAAGRSLRAARERGGGGRVARRCRFGASVYLSFRRRFFGRGRRPEISALGISTAAARAIRANSLFRPRMGPARRCRPKCRTRRRSMAIGSSPMVQAAAATAIHSIAILPRCWTTCLTGYSRRKSRASIMASSLRTVRWTRQQLRA